MKRAILAVAFTAVSTIAYAENANDRLKEASEVVQELMNAADKGVPQDLLESAKCAVIIPGAKKGGFFVGGQYGRGFAICRNESTRGWGAPAAVRMEGGSIGLQIGGAETDIFMLVMNDEGVKKLLDSKFTLDARRDFGPRLGPTPCAQAAAGRPGARQILASWSRDLL
jgi:lipid-binding SYLF domain-containing protein